MTPLGKNRLSYKISCDLLSSLWGEFNSRIFLKILEHYFGEHSDSHHKIIREILEFKTQYRLCLSLKKIGGLGNWRIKRFIVDCGFFMRVANIGNIIGIERNVKPSSFIRNESKNIVPLAKPLIKRSSAADEFIEEKVNKAKVSIMAAEKDNQPLVEERIKKSEERIRNNSTNDRSLFKPQDDGMPRKNSKFLKKHLSNFEKSRTEMRNETITPTFRDVLKRGLENDRYDTKEKTIIKKFVESCDSCLKKVESIDSAEFRVKLLKSAKRRNLSPEENIERKKNVIRNKVSNKLSGSFFLCKQYKNANCVVSNKFEVLSNINSLTSSSFDITEVDEAESKLVERAQTFVYETFKKVKKVEEYIELREEERVYSLIKLKAGQINDIKHATEYKFDEWLSNRNNELAESENREVREDERILKVLENLSQEISEIKNEIIGTEFDLRDIFTSYSRGDFKLRGVYSSKITKLKSVLALKIEEHKNAVMVNSHVIKRSEVRVKMAECKQKINRLESELEELGKRKKEKNERGSFKPGRDKQGVKSIKEAKRVERLNKELLLEKEKLSKLESI
jgi:hypothetical protein